MPVDIPEQYKTDFNESLVVVASPFFPHKLSTGYSPPYGQVVKSINGVPVKNLGHLVEMLRNDTNDYARIEFDSRASESLVFPRAEMISATDQILTDNGIRSQGSPDMLSIWNGDASKK
jgi:hypothetical protein